jgi:BirA family biotin operon repressor/biotin-[acetyl-CoA-carboxylase] ligase
MVKRLKLSAIGGTIHYFKSIASTQDLAISFAKAGIEEGVVVWADEQTKGRGRFGRKWFSLPSKSLSFSFILRPKLKADLIPYLSLFPVIACASVLEKLSARCELKWPNDILIEGKKVGGILVDVEIKENKIEWAVVGIGINVNLERDDFPSDIRQSATSLRIALRKSFDDFQLLKEILRELNEKYSLCFSDKGREKIREEWEKRDFLRGKEIEVMIGEKRIRGIGEGIDGRGFLRVRIGEKIVAFSGGEVYFMEKQ